jgi:hypothetical protein
MRSIELDKVLVVTKAEVVCLKIYILTNFFGVLLCPRNIDPPFRHYTSEKTCCDEAIIVPGRTRRPKCPFGDLRFDLSAALSQKHGVRAEPLVRPWTLSWRAKTRKTPLNLL